MEDVGRSGIIHAISRFLSGRGAPPAGHRYQVLFVCTENICRSPMAEGILRQQLKNREPPLPLLVSSAGTRSSNPGSRPDPRALRVAAGAGVDFGRIRASRVTETMLVESDFIFAMDRSNLRDLQAICPAGHESKITLLLSHLPGAGLEDVPDPYYGSSRGFEEVFELIDRAVRALLSRGGLLDPTKLIQP